ncbi:MAG: glutamate--tRNA ligase [Candidatus Diapherotrites archaeon CG08_land_8_20_14_0_20_34_12]|nr:MAG: glutamate--tRNA ligase [Candidatus Diapherotrites archaeon CG08_land_8_20_14_0_20_34_12]
MQVKEIAYKYAIKNAYEHEGKADIGAVVGKVKAVLPEIDLKKEMIEIKNAVSLVNSFGIDEIRKEFERFNEEGFELKPREQREGLAELDWVKEGIQVVTRYAPNPNGPFHLGNARAAITSHEYARMYNGRFLLRFDDTDPKVKKPIENAEQIFKEDLSWLNCKVDETYFASDRLEIYYNKIEELLQAGNAYVCTCKVEDWREKAKKKEACICRDLEVKEQLQRFIKMKNHEFKEGEAIARIKTDLKHKDPSVRDWWLCRVIDNPKHPRAGTKYHVWPSYNFASAIDDHLLGVTLIIRGQEHEQNETKQRFLYKYFNWEYPHAIYFGRIAIEGSVLSTSKIKKGIEEGLYIGWDDPRLGTIRALRRRGFTPEALTKVIINLGTNPNDAKILWSTLAALNKDVIAEKVEKLTFMKEPLKLSADLVPKTSAELDGKIYELNAGVQEFFIDREIISKYKAGQIVRMRNAYNVRIKTIDEYQVTAEYAGDMKIKEVIPWLLDGIDIELMMPDAKKIIGLCDSELLNKKVNDHIYFDRFGFVRIDSIDEKRPCVWFTHS